MRSSRILAPFLTLSLLALPLSCARYDRNEPADPCTDITCSGHGTCVVSGESGRCECDDMYETSQDGKLCLPIDDACLGITCSGYGVCTRSAGGKARCVCDDGYEPHPDDPLVCLAITCTRVGDPCAHSTDCCQNLCLKDIGAPEGYCSLTDCADDDECTQAAGGSRMCCVQSVAEKFVCTRLGAGCDCLEQSGTCGSSCHCTWHSACAPGTLCLGAGPEDPNATCSLPCTQGSDCGACTDPDLPDAIFACTEIFGGDTYCLRHDCCHCDSSQNCPNDEVCFPQSDANGNLTGVCGRLGARPPGAQCDEAINPDDLPFEERCADFYCLDGYCSAVCSHDLDCPQTMDCRPLSFCLDESCQTVAEINMCQRKECCLEP